jgi:hypothetical protein
MDLHCFDPLATSMRRGLSRRAALGRLGGGGLAAALLATAGLERRTAAQDATPAAAPAGWRTERLEIDVTPQDPVSITRAGGGPPQRGDWFYVDAPIFAAGDAGGTQVGTYQCFGAWTHASDDTAAPDLRLTTVQFRWADGSIMGLINELGTDPNAIFGAVQGGTGKYTGALGTFQQIPQAPAATPAAGTPALPVPAMVRTTFELLLPDLG